MNLPFLVSYSSSFTSLIALAVTHDLSLRFHRPQVGPVMDAAMERVYGTQPPVTDSTNTE